MITGLRRLIGAAALLLLAVGGCGSVERAVDSGLSAAGRAAGERVGAALGDQLAARVNLPAFGTAQWNRFMASQAQVFFTHAISAGGYWPGRVSYAQGEWTRFEMRSSGENEPTYRFERAYLTQTESNQWWRISAEYDQGSWVYEALVDTSAEQMVRLRAKDPDGNVGEIPVEENTIYRSPQELTEESLDGASMGIEEISVPAGTFSAERIEYAGVAGGGTVSWWISSEVPGGIVRYQISEDGDPVWTSSLVDYGTGATTELDSY